MARGRYYYDPSRKHLEEFQDFSGGLNTMSSNDNISDRELVQLENFDLGDRGSLQRRKGFQSKPNMDASGKPQMLHRFHRKYSPYNLLGVGGSFDGLRKESNGHVSIGGWYAFGMENEENAYKVDREGASDLIYNGDFEKGEDGWHLDVDRHNIGDSLVGKSVAAESGNNVLRLRIYEGHSGFLNEYQTWDNEFNVNPGDKIEAKVRYRRSAHSIGKVPYRVHLVASVKYSNGERKRHYIRAYDTDDNWRTLQGTFTMPSGAVSCLLGVGILDDDMKQDTAAYFEDFEAYKLSNDLAVNGNFENGSTGWDLNNADQWDSYIGTSVHAYNGSNVLRINKYGTSNIRGINEYQKDSIPVKYGDKITVSARYHRSAYHYGESIYKARLVVSFWLEDGTNVRQYHDGYNISGDWQKLEKTFTVPKGATHVYAGLGAYDRYTNDVGVYFDDFHVYKHEMVSVDGKFENGETNWNLNVEEIRAGVSYIGSSSLAIEGSNVMRIQRFKGHGGFYNEYQSYDHQLSVQEGDEIYAEGWYRRAASQFGKSPHRVHLIASVGFKDGHRERQYIRKYDVDNTWKKISGYFKMPKGAVNVVFGFGLIDNNTDDNVAAYFDGLYARREIQGSEQSVLAIRSSLGDTRSHRGLGLKFNGIEANKYYLYVVDFKTDGVGEGGLAIRDERFGVYPNDNGAVMNKAFSDKPTEWSTQYMKFQTYDHMEKARAYVYNWTPAGTESIVYYDNARIYEVTSEIYEKIDNDPDYTGEKLGERFPYRVGQLTNELHVETITAVGGKFFIDGKEKEVIGDVPIQTERIMEAATYGNNLYIASGSGLLVYNGSTIAPIIPYIPDPLEELYIGTNALQSNPYEISDEEQSVVQLKQIRFSRRYGVTNKDITLSVSTWKPGGTSLEFKFERRNVRDKEDYWLTLQDWSTSNTITFNTDIAGEYQFRVSVRKTGEELVLDEYKIPKYIIRPTNIEEEDLPIDGNTIHRCNRILIHWNRIIMYGDDVKQDVMYISDLDNMRYFPVNNTLRFLNPRKERITTIVPYRDDLVVFTPSSIQALFGTNPEDYQRVMLNTDYGCIADRGAKVVKNHVVFPSREGIALLKSVGTSETRFNVDLIDNNIKNLVEYDSEAVAYVRDNQYGIVYPNHEKQLRYYYEWGVWTSDVSPSLDMVDISIEDGKLYALGSDGRTLQDSQHYHDEGVIYEAKVSTKLFDFGEPYAIKKTKELQLMFDDLEQPTSIVTDVFLDNPYRGKKTEKVPDFEYAVTYEDQTHTWKTTINNVNNNTLKKGFANNEFKTEEAITDFADREDAFIVFAGSDGTKGLQIRHGVIYQESSDDQEVNESLAIYEDGTLGIVTPTSDLTNVKHTFHSDYPYLVDGTKNTGLDNADVRPRQAIGQRNDGSLVILTVGGNPNENSAGCTLDELADMLLAEDCIVGYCLGSENKVQFYENGDLKNVYFDDKEKRASDYLYLTKDVTRVVEGKRSGIIKSETINLTTDDDIYKITTPGKGLTVGTFISHKDNKPLKLVGMGYIFKLKKP